MEQSDGKEHVEQITNSSSADGGTSGATSAVGAGAGASTASTEKGGDAIVYAHYGGGGSSSGGRGGGSLSVVDQVKAFFFEELSFTDLFNEWASDNRGVVDPDSDEMKLEYTALHNSFLQLFEEKVSKVISAAGSSPTEFYKELKTAERSNPSGSDARFAQMMLAAIEFPAFIDLMKDVEREAMAAATAASKK